MIQLEITQSLKEKLQKQFCQKPKHTIMKLGKDLVSLNGYDFFPEEFCTQAFLNTRERRNTIQLKKLVSITRSNSTKYKTVSPSP